MDSRNKVLTVDISAAGGPRDRFTGPDSGSAPLVTAETPVWSDLPRRPSAVIDRIPAEVAVAARIGPVNLASVRQAEKLKIG